MSIVSADFGGRRMHRRVVRWTLTIVALLVIFWLLPRVMRFYSEWLWFKFDVRFPGVFWTVLKTKILLFVVFGAAFFVFLLGNVELARRLARRTIWYDEERELRQRIAEVMEYFASRYLYLGLLFFALLAAYLVGIGAAQQWNKYLLFRSGTPFGIEDPIFHRDIGFYVFRLPFWKYLQQWVYWVLIGVFILSAATHYLDKAIRMLRGVPALASHVKSHLSVLLGAILVVKALGYKLAAFYLLYSERCATFGASYTDVHAQWLAYKVLFVIALFCAVLVLINMYLRGLWLPLAGIGLLAVSSLLLNVVYPAVVQRLHVVPNEFERESPYIAHTIEFTRRGFGLHEIQERELRGIEPLTMDAIARNVAAVENLRLWDYRPLLDTYQQQQALWPYYRFNSVDIDRYYINGQYRQVMLAGRELSVEGLPEKGWQNERIFNTHGYGVVMSPVSDVIQSGLPNLVVKDIPPTSSFDLEVTRPAIYYGELTNDYVIVNTTESENDYPLPATNQTAKVNYSGEGGVPIGSALPRLATSIRFSDLNIIISRVITGESRILWGRNIGWRARHIAPFLSYDRDPYIVVGDDGHLYWIQDAYTTSGMYPYSEPYQIDGGRFNYVRNSVKAVTDAYDGTVVFYVADPEDPIIQTYQRIFPDLFRPMSEMPGGLMAHIRYPEALFNTQSDRLTVYHMTDPRAFYNRIEKWEIARESPKAVGPTGRRFLASQQGESQGETMQGYYAIMNLPGEPEPEFLLMLPFTPQDKPNMVAWLAARCDGEDYGKLLIYYFPKTQQVWGPIQIEASINQDTEISQLMTLWNQQGSSVIRGNLLVIPVENSILYVEPIYLRAAQSPIPELKRVVLAGGDGTVVMESTLSGALAALLGESPPELAAVEPRQVSRVAPAVAEPQVSEEAPAEPSGLPASARELALQADRQFEQAMERQRQGDWTGYGEAVQELQRTLQQLVEETEQ